MFLFFYDCISFIKNQMQLYYDLIVDYKIVPMTKAFLILLDFY